MKHTNGVKHEAIAAGLREAIRADELLGKLPNQRELAKQFDVHPITMGKALKSLVDEGLIERRPGVGTRVIDRRAQRTKRLGFVLYGQSGFGPMAMSLHNGVHAAAEIHQQTVLLRGHNQDSQYCLEVVRRLVKEHRVDGVVMWPSMREPVPGGRSPAVEFLLREHVPVVLIPEPDLGLYPDCSTVSNAGSGAMGAIVDHLIEVGHREIVFVSDEPVLGHDHPAHRHDQYRQHMTLAGLSPQPPVLIPNVHQHVGVDLDPMAQAALRAATAAVCVTDDAAATVVRTCAKAGMRVPDDLAVSGYNNSHIAHLLDLTSVEQHFGLIGEKGVELLLSEIEGASPSPQHVDVRSELVLRGSTGCPDPLVDGAGRVPGGHRRGRHRDGTVSAGRTTVEDLLERETG